MSRNECISHIYLFGLTRGNEFTSENNLSIILCLSSTFETYHLRIKTVNLQGFWHPKRETTATLSYFVYNVRKIQTADNDRRGVDEEGSGLMKQMK